MLQQTEVLILSSGKCDEPLYQCVDCGELLTPEIEGETSENIMLFEAAMSTIKHYRCSKCWGMLTADSLPKTRLMRVHCWNEDHFGFVREETVDRVVQQDLVDFSEAKSNLRGIIDVGPKISAKQAIEDLFG